MCFRYNYDIMIDFLLINEKNHRLFIISCKEGISYEKQYRKHAEAR